ncbi:hypothetical protein PR048_030539 [Dryococelus australis]|uniref:Uncharacterized protein n=1 Tax=Dryococelus australis TaxID=614101 RepID=A0ABQ9GC33_9NEOP|nr:hypothetical protein PR048_030539 [Dryococelus australis]
MEYTRNQSYAITADSFGCVKWQRLTQRNRLCVANARLHHRGSKLDLRSGLRSTQKTVATFEFRTGLEIEMRIISNRRNWQFQNSIRDQQPSSSSIYSEKYAYFHDVIHYEPIAKFSRTESRSLTFEPRPDESDIQNHEISLVQHFYIGTKIKPDPGSELGSLDFGSGKMLARPGISVSSKKLGQACRTSSRERCYVWRTARLQRKFLGHITRADNAATVIELSTSSEIQSWYLIPHLRKKFASNGMTVKWCKEDQRRDERAEETGDPGERCRRPAASSGTIPTCENPELTLPGDVPGLSWWEASRLTTQSPPPQEIIAFNVPRHQGEPRLIPGRFTPGFRKWESCRTIPLVGGFSRGSPISPALSFRRCFIVTSLHPHIGSQDLDVKSRPNLFALFSQFTKWRSPRVNGFARAGRDGSSRVSLLRNEQCVHFTPPPPSRAAAASLLRMRRRLIRHVASARARDPIGESESKVYSTRVGKLNAFNMASKFFANRLKKTRFGPKLSRINLRGIKRDCAMFPDARTFPCLYGDSWYCTVVKLREYEAAPELKGGETGDPRENPLTSGITHHDPYLLIGVVWDCTNQCDVFLNLLKAVAEYALFTINRNATSVTSSCNLDGFISAWILRPTDLVQSVAKYYTVSDGVIVPNTVPQAGELCWHLSDMFNELLLL